MPRPAPEQHDDEVLSLDGVSVWLGGRQILEDVGFSVRRGEFVGLIGSNGAGKTTLFRVVLGLLSPNRGAVRVGANGPHSTRSRSIGYVPQKVVVDPDIPLRARDLIALGMDGHRVGAGVPRRARRAAVDEMLDAVDATGFATARVGSLSGGELQRVLIAHALISRPRLLVLDEPLANLDIRSEQEVVELLGRVAREQEVAVLLSAHDMNPLLAVMDRVVYLANGRAASGSTDEVIRPEVLSGLYGHPVAVLHVHDRIIIVAGPTPVPDLSAPRTAALRTVDGGVG
ncbi:MAG: metal ABC transporter ATP-binding protein [Acidimicrobiales bacterium]|jgi:zinc/manganese transport system ATP-binding protein